MKIDLVASLPHYAAHTLPIFEALPDHVRGEMVPLSEPCLRPRPGRAALVGGWQDVAELSGRVPMVYVEHGAGQSYAGDPRSARMPGYSASGGARHNGVIGFVCPNEQVAGRWTTAPAIAAGCAKLDQYVGRPNPPRWNVCFAWHWDGTEVCPEARSAFPHYEEGLRAAVELLELQGFDVFGHAHPRWRGKIDDRLAAVGLKVLKHEREVFDTCGTLFVDNSSLGVEFMALGRPVIWLNSPHYRPGVDHGGRFWTWTSGIPTYDSIEDILTNRLFDEVMMYPTASADAHAAATYANLGSASRVAADWITGLIEHR